MTATKISNGDNLINSRDIIARIEEIEELFANEEINEDNGATPQFDDDGKMRVEIATCGKCGKSWNDALLSASTPAPSGRCPYERIHEALAELRVLQAVVEEASGTPDWTYGETLIRDSYFKEYAQELAEDCGMLQNVNTWPNRCIDWDQAADELKQDYFSVDFDGVEYWIRG